MVLKHFVKYEGVYYAPGEDVPLTAEDETRIIAEMETIEKNRIEMEQRMAELNMPEERNLNKPMSAAKLN